MAARIRECYPACSLGVFLPEVEGFRAGLFGADDRTLHFDRGGRFLWVDGWDINRTVNENKTNDRTILHLLNFNPR